MIQRLRNILLSIGVFSVIAAPFALTTSVYANDTIQNGLTCGSNFQTNNGSGNCGGTSGDTFDIPGIMTMIINVFSIIVGFVAVVMIIIGGIRYITSGGDSGNISAAKNTIIYAVIGLIIVALAQVIVHFVLNKLSAASNG